MGHTLRVSCHRPGQIVARLQPRAVQIRVLRRIQRVGLHRANMRRQAHDCLAERAVLVQGQSSEQRRAFSLRLVGDGVRFARREGIVTSPPFTQVQLKDGDPLQADEFPVLIPA